MEVNNLFWGVIMFFLVMNSLAFLVMLVDKNKSRVKNAQRISEGMMFFLAAAFGSLGVFAGMLAFRHKTKKWNFIIGIPFLLAQNVVFLYWVYDLLK